MNLFRSIARPYLVTTVFTLLLSLYTTNLLAGAQGDQAIATVKELVSKGVISKDSVLNLTVKQGNIAAFLGRNSELQKQWEQETGILIDANVMPQVASYEFIQQAQDVDLTIARNREYPDLFSDGLIEDLTPLMERFGFSLPDDSTSGYLRAKSQSYFMNRIVAIPADGDTAMLYLRKDLLENTNHKQAFKKRFGYELAVPKTWNEYQDQVSYFHNPEQGFFGAVEQRDPATGWMFWMPRYASSAMGNQFLFDDEMRPLIDTPQGIKATENYLATIPYSPEKILEPGNDYSYTLPLFMQGKGYSTIITIAGAKLFSLDRSAIKDKFIAVPMPGYQHGEGLIRRGTFIYGNNLVIPANSKNKELALLFAMWLTDPRNSVKSVGVPGGFSDPYRYNHLTHPHIQRTYTVEALSVFEYNLLRSVPAGTGLPGDREYIAYLNKNLSLAGHGKLTAQQAMSETAKAWEQITEERGRNNQIKHWKAFKILYPSIIDPLR